MTAAAVWLAVGMGHQETDNQVPDVERFVTHHGYEVRCRYEVVDSRGNDGKDGVEYRNALDRALDDAHHGKFSVIVVWALDRIAREGAEGALRVIHQFAQRGCKILSVKESWLNAGPEVQDVLVAFAGWMAQQDSKRRSDRIKTGLGQRRVAGKPVGRQPGAVDKTPRKRAGYVASWESGPRRAAYDARTARQEAEAR